MTTVTFISKVKTPKKSSYDYTFSINGDTLSFHISKIAEVGQVAWVWVANQGDEDGGQWFNSKKEALMALCNYVYGRHYYDHNIGYASTSSPEITEAATALYNQISK